MTFLFRKSWLLFSLVPFLTSQSSLELLETEQECSEQKRVIVFGCRAITYPLGMTQLIYTHVSKTFRLYPSKDLATSRIDRKRQRHLDTRSCHDVRPRANSLVLQ